MTQLPSPPQWQKLSEDVWKTDLGTDRPEVVILQMPDDEFKRFHASTSAAKDYLDKRRYLKRELIAVIFGEVVPQNEGGVWTIIVAHTVRSTAVVVAWQNPKHSK